MLVGENIDEFGESMTNYQSFLPQIYGIFKTVGVILTASFTPHHMGGILPFTNLIVWSGHLEAVSTSYWQIVNVLHESSVFSQFCGTKKQ